MEGKNKAKNEYLWGNTLRWFLSVNEAAKVDCLRMPCIYKKILFRNGPFPSLLFEMFLEKNVLGIEFETAWFFGRKHFYERTSMKKPITSYIFLFFLLSVFPIEPRMCDVQKKYYAQHVHTICKQISRHLL